MRATIMSKKRVKTSLTLTVNAETSAFVVALPHAKLRSTGTLHKIKLWLLELDS